MHVGAIAAHVDVLSTGRGWVLAVVSGDAGRGRGMRYVAHACPCIAVHQAWIAVHQTGLHYQHYQHVLYLCTAWCDVMNRRSTRSAAFHAQRLPAPMGACTCMGVVHAYCEPLARITSLSTRCA